MTSVPFERRPTVQHFPEPVRRFIDEYYDSSQPESLPAVAFHQAIVRLLAAMRLLAAAWRQEISWELGVGGALKLLALALCYFSLTTLSEPS
jgi:hypothetical protein